MDADELQSRISKNKETIAKKEALIEKRMKKARKLVDKLTGMDLGVDAPKELTVETLTTFICDVTVVIRARVKEGGSVYQDPFLCDAYETNDELHDCVESVENAIDAIMAKYATNQKLKAQLEKVNSDEARLEAFPQVMLDFRDNVAEMWDLWDKMRRASVKEAHEEDARLTQAYNNREITYDQRREAYEELRENYTPWEWSELPWMSDDQIHEKNLKEANILTLNFGTRVEDIVETIEDATDLRVSRDNQGYAIINGTVKGNGKVARVQSVGAGGWNIQRFHIRVLVHELKGAA